MKALSYHKNILNTELGFEYDNQFSMNLNLKEIGKHLKLD